MSPRALSNPDTPATATRATTASQPCPWVTAPMASPAAPPNTAALQTRFTRLRYGPPASANVPSSPPVAGSTPSEPRPAANDTDRGTQIASAARAISGHGTGARRGRTISASHSGTTTALNGRRDRTAAAPLIAVRRTRLFWPRTGEVTAPARPRAVAEYRHGGFPVSAVPGRGLRRPARRGVGRRAHRDRAELPRLDSVRPGASRRGGIPAQGDADARGGGAGRVAAAVAGRRGAAGRAGPGLRRAARRIPHPRARPGRADLVRPRPDGGLLDPQDGAGDGDPPDRRRAGGRPARHPGARRPCRRRRRRGPQADARLRLGHLAGGLRRDRGRSPGRAGRDHGRSGPGRLDGPPVAALDGGRRRRQRRPAGGGRRPGRERAALAVGPGRRRRDPDSRRRRLGGLPAPPARRSHPVANQPSRPGTHVASTRQAGSALTARGSTPAPRRPDSPRRCRVLY